MLDGESVHNITWLVVSSTERQHKIIGDIHKD